MARVLFIQKQTFFQQERIGIMQMSAVLKAQGHGCDILILKVLTAEYLKEILAYNPDIIAFSVMSIEADWFLEIGEQLKRAGVPSLIVAGGPHPSFFPAYLNNDCIDAINIGEGELSLLELADSISKGKDISTIKNLHIKRSGAIYKNDIRALVDFNSLPFPDREMYLKYPPFKTQGTYDFLFSRGCPYTCNYCFAHQWNALYAHHTPTRFKDVDKCIEEVVDFSKKVNVKLVYFQDSTFNLNKRWTIEFLKKYGAFVKIPFSINLRPNLVDEEVVRATAETGCCKTVRIGIESGSERVRMEVLNKRITDKQIYEAVNLFKKYRIKMVAYVMLGLPSETFKEAWDTIYMIQRIKPFSFSSQIFHPYPSLRLTEYAIENGYLKREDINKVMGKDLRYYAFKSILSQPEIEQVVNTLMVSVPAIRFPWLSHFLKFVAQRRQNMLLNVLYTISIAFMLGKQLETNFINIILQFLKINKKNKATT